MAKDIGFKSNATWPIPPSKDDYSPIHIPPDDGPTSEDLNGALASEETLPSPAKRACRPIRLPTSQAIDTTDAIVAVTVGTAPDRKVFHIHASVLHSSSEYMKTKFKPEWLKGSATVDLSHQDPDAFHIYANWLYQSQILSLARVNTKREWISLARAFALGEELIDQAFKNAVMSALSGAAQRCQVDDILPFIALMVWIVYDATPEKSPARNFLVDVGKSLEKGQLKKLHDELHHDFVLDLVEALANGDTAASIGGKRKYQPISTVSRNVLVYHREVRESREPAKMPVKNRYGARNETLA